MNTIEQALTLFLQDLTPSPSHREASVKHRAGIESSLYGGLNVSSLREIGSYIHGTAVRNHSDVDLLVGINGSRPEKSDTALDWVKAALKRNFPNAPISVDRPSVVIQVAGGERWELTPGFHKLRRGIDIYDIPGVYGGWIEAAPTEHQSYVNGINSQARIRGGAKELSRLVKAWKYFNEVPVVSFYLEMRAAEYMSTRQSYYSHLDICYFLEHLDDIGLAPMDDPTHATNYVIHGTGSFGYSHLAKLRLHAAAERAQRAVDAVSAGDLPEALTAYYLLFAEHFPLPLRGHRWSR